ncbi:MAG: ASCH domain-containing protein [Verrucomicrobiota bacterium]
MKAISLRQPWAWLIIEGHKPIENRTWETKFRGDIQIHAAKGCTQTEYDEAVAFVRSFNPVLAAGIPPLDRLEKGGIIGLVKITDCVQRHPSRFFVGPFGFVMERPYPLPFRPMRGMLGIFNVNEQGEPEEIANG